MCNLEFIILNSLGVHDFLDKFWNVKTTNLTVYPETKKGTEYLNQMSMINISVSKNIQFCMDVTAAHRNN